jgi:ATP-dependent Lon protease
MEIIRLPGYTEEEKLEIAKRYLIPRQRGQAGLAEEQFTLRDDTVRSVISQYTREAGLRRLEQSLAKIARKTTLKLSEHGITAVVISPEDLVEILGPQPFTEEQIRKNPPPGQAIGLAWTETGGDVLYVEATLLPEGKGLTLTGQLGDVMQESAKAAQSWIWSHSAELQIDSKILKESGVHIHVPAGATPKDGPSAGITMAVTLASMYAKQPVRDDTAMTGEITLGGLVLPIGGVKEKVLAARRAGIKRVILPQANKKDLRDLPDPVRNEMEFVFVSRVEEVLAAAIPTLELQPMAA